MCRSIKTLREGATPASDEEIRAAALQFVRKVSGFTKPARHNEAVFDAFKDTAEGKVFLTVHMPSPRIVVTGAVRVAIVSVIVVVHPLSWSGVR